MGPPATAEPKTFLEKIKGLIGSETESGIGGFRWKWIFATVFACLLISGSAILFLFGPQINCPGLQLSFIQVLAGITGLVGIGLALASSLPASEQVIENSFNCSGINALEIEKSDDGNNTAGQRRLL